MKLKTILNRIVKAIAWGVCFFVPIDRNKIVVSSYYGKGYGDNPKYVVERLLNSGKKIVWIVKDKEAEKSLPDGVTPCKKTIWRTIFQLSTARVWIDNCRKGLCIKKKGQRYIQLWHGFAMKQIEADAEAVLADSYVSCAKHDSKNIDVIVSDSSHMTKIYQKSFWYDGQVCEFGMPRNDIIFLGDDKIKQKVRSYFDLPENVGIILYAPTFRADLSMSAYLNEFDELCKICEHRFSKRYVALLRLHPNISDRIAEMRLDEKNALDATAYPDLQELLAATDILVSDYSSLMFDYMITKKPCFIYAADIEAYAEDRNFYFDIRSTPFSVCTSKKELYEAVNELDVEEYAERVESFMDLYGIVRTDKASEKCAEWILSRM